MLEKHPWNSNGNKMNMRVDMIEGLLRASEQAGGSAKTNALKHALKKNKTDMANDASSSLELMRIIFQNDISTEINNILDRHRRTTFAKAIENLTRNGQEVNQTVMNDLYANILEGAKKQFVREPVVVKELHEVEISGDPFKPPSTDKMGYESDDSTMSGMSQNSEAHRMRQGRKEEERLSLDLSPYTSNEIGKWNPDRFGLTTLFVHASKVAGLSGQTATVFFQNCNRMFRYSCDDTDKQFLMDSGQLDRVSGRCYLVCLDDAREVIGRSQDLESSAFCLKEWQVVKVRRYAQPIFERLRQRILATQSQQQQQQQQQQQLQQNHWPFHQ